MLPLTELYLSALRRSWGSLERLAPVQRVFLNCSALVSLTSDPSARAGSRDNFRRASGSWRELRALPPSEG